jgi:hypothetical protein
MDSKPEYIQRISKMLKKTFNIDGQIDTLSQEITSMLESQNMIICKSDNHENNNNQNDNDNGENILENYTRDNDDELIQNAVNEQTEEMSYLTIQGHVYLVTKDKRVFTCNKENPIEIGRLVEIGDKNIIERFEGFEEY